MYRNNMILIEQYINPIPEKTETEYHILTIAKRK